MDAGSKINSLLTLEYMQREHENKYFDRKSARIRVAELAPLISAFANAEINGANSATRIRADFRSKYLFSCSLCMYSSVRSELIFDPASIS